MAPGKEYKFSVPSPPLAAHKLVCKKCTANVKIVMIIVSVNG